MYARMLIRLGVIVALVAVPSAASQPRISHRYHAHPTIHLRMRARPTDNSVTVESNDGGVPPSDFVGDVTDVPTGGAAAVSTPDSAVGVTASASVAASVTAADTAPPIVSDSTQTIHAGDETPIVTTRASPPEPTESAVGGSNSNDLPIPPAPPSLLAECGDSPAEQLDCLLDVSDRCAVTGGGCGVLLELEPFIVDDIEACKDFVTLAAQVCAQCGATQEIYDLYNAYLKNCDAPGGASDINPKTTTTTAVLDPSDDSSTSNAPDDILESPTAVITAEQPGGTGSTGVEQVITMTTDVQVTVDNVLSQTAEITEDQMPTTAGPSVTESEAPAPTVAVASTNTIDAVGPPSGDVLDTPLPPTTVVADSSITRTGAEAAPPPMSGTTPDQISTAVESPSTIVTTSPGIVALETTLIIVTQSATFTPIYTVADTGDLSHSDIVSATGRDVSLPSTMTANLADTVTASLADTTSPVEHLTAMISTTESASIPTLTAAMEQTKEFFQYEVSETCAADCQAWVDEYKARTPGSAWLLTLQACTAQDDVCICTPQTLAIAATCSSCTSAAGMSPPEVYSAQVAAYAAFRGNCSAARDSAESTTVSRHPVQDAYSCLLGQINDPSTAIATATRLNAIESVQSAFPTQSASLGLPSGSDLADYVEGEQVEEVITVKAGFHGAPPPTVYANQGAAGSLPPVVSSGRRVCGLDKMISTTFALGVTTLMVA